MKVVLRNKTDESGVEYSLVDYRNEGEEVVRVHEWKKGNVEVYAGHDEPHMFSLGSASENLDSKDVSDLMAVLEVAIRMVCN